MHSLNPGVLDWLASHHGVIANTDLERLGVTCHQRERLLRLGVLTRYIRGVYRSAAAPATVDQAAALACAVGADVVLSHRSAGRLWKLRRLGPGPAPDHIEVL